MVALISTLPALALAVLTSLVPGSAEATAPQALSCPAAGQVGGGASGDPAPGEPAEAVDGWVRSQVGHAWQVDPACVEVAWPGERRGAAPSGSPLALEGSGAGGRWTVVLEEEGRRRRVPVRTGAWSLRPVATRSLPRGAVLAEGDAEFRTVLLHGPAEGPALPLGWVAARPIAPGGALEPPAVHPPLAVRVGQEVEVHRSGVGLRAWVRGVALRSGAAGDTVEVRVRGGERRRGRVVEDGRVELIRPGTPGGANR